VAVDVDGDGIGLVPVDGSDSHTHGPDETLVRFVWKKGMSIIIGTGEITTLSLSVGQHEISLTVTDSSGDQNTDTTVITVRPQSYPWVKSLTPTSGGIAGGTSVTISGSGFTSATEVRFGSTILNRASIVVRYLA
jgi:IPT/TIG domain